MNLSKKHKEQTKELTDNICKKSKKVTIFLTEQFFGTVSSSDNGPTVHYTVKRERVYTTCI